MGIVTRLKQNVNLLGKEDNNLILKFIEILDDRQVFVTFSECLLEIEDIQFVSKVVSHLNVILLQRFQKETKKLWEILSNPADSSHEQVFEALFSAWVRWPQAALTLSLVAGRFDLSYYLMLRLS